MIIGIDFDNTIANYTGVFYQVGVRLGWLPKHIGQSKSEVKQYFIDNKNEPKWTELQGIVYGKEVHQAQPYVNCVQMINNLVDKGHELHIISHKTKYPIIGDKVNFHHAALGWLYSHNIISENGPISPIYVHFNQTQQEKVNKIAALNCDVFIDDLIEIFSITNFPAHCRPIWFTEQKETTTFQKMNNWQQLHGLL